MSNNEIYLIRTCSNKIMLIKVPRRQKERFRLKILDWYKKNKRDLPWRKTTDPYKILVSEIMLQQTQVDRVIPKYLAWIKHFPNLKTLAKASTKDLLQYWSGLGYNSRALRLQKLAQEVIKNHNGKLPEDENVLIKLPGIGPYTARSVLIFAHNKNMGTVDTNIRRIFIHEFKLDESFKDQNLLEFAHDITPKNQSCDWHNALMDYGATYLTSKKTGIRPVSRQSKFKGSKRMYRGKILKLLLQGNKTISQLNKECNKDVKDIINELKGEGMVKVKGKTVFIE